MVLDIRLEEMLNPIVPIPDLVMEGYTCNGVDGSFLLLLLVMVVGWGEGLALHTQTAGSHNNILTLPYLELSQSHS